MDKNKLTKIGLIVASTSTFLVGTTSTILLSLPLIDPCTSYNYDYEISDDGTIISYLGNDINISIPGIINGVHISKIGDGAFSNRANIKSIKIPSVINYLGNNVFTNCTSLESVKFYGDISYIGKETFKSCSSLESISLPNGLLSLEDQLFNNCSSLKVVTLNDDLLTIKDDVFINTSLDYIVIPNSITSIYFKPVMESSEYPSILYYGDEESYNNITSINPTEYKVDISNIKLYSSEYKENCWRYINNVPVLY